MAETTRPAGDRVAHGNQDRLQSEGTGPPNAMGQVESRSTRLQTGGAKGGKAGGDHLQGKAQSRSSLANAGEP